MKRECAQMWPGLVTLAEGGTDPEAAAHVAGCADCARRLEEVRESIRLLKSGFSDAPQSLIQSAKDLMPQRVPVRAQLLRTTLGPAGARGGDAFQSVYEFEGGTVRVMYQPQAAGWMVLGRVDGIAWESDQAEIADDGRFEFSSQELSGAEILLRRGDVEVLIPAPTGESADDA